MIKHAAVLLASTAIVIACGGSGPGEAVSPPARLCGRAPGAPIVPKKGPYENNPHCDALATTWGNIPHGDRACRRDADCQLVVNGCALDALTKSAATKSDYAQPDCNIQIEDCKPGPSERPVSCSQGCCTVL